MSCNAPDTPALPLDSRLRSAAQSLLHLNPGSTWSIDELCEIWCVPLQFATQWVQVLRPLGLIREDGTGYRMPQEARMLLLGLLLECGHLDEALRVLRRWILQGCCNCDPTSLGDAFDQIANVLLLARQPATALQALEVSMRLRSRAGDLCGRAARAWSIGAFLAQHGKVGQALPYLQRAMWIASELAMPQASQYRMRLESLRTQLP